MRGSVFSNIFFLSQAPTRDILFLMPGLKANSNQLKESSRMGSMEET